ncbi:MAG: urease accessory protein UreD [Alistipes sp.]|nr:urease accessory protein UreD [Alistipes sp.]
MKGAAIRELHPYLGSGAVPAASAGKCGCLRLGFELDGRGRSIMRDLERRAPLIVQQELYFDEEMPEMPCVYILSSGGPNVDGDRYEQCFTVRRNAFAHISTGAATKLAEMRCDYSGMKQHFELEEGAYLEYLPEPTIPCRHTRFACETTIRIAESATLFYSEIYTSGRRYFRDERFAYDLLSVSTAAERPSGRRLFRERFVIEPSRGGVESRGVMSGFEIFGNAVVLAPPASVDAIYARTDAFIDRERGLAAGVTRLPDDCGLSLRVLGRETEQVKHLMREFCSTVRMTVKGKPLFREFPWR